MSVVLGAGGWLLAVTGIGLAALARLRLSRHADAVARASHEVRGPLTAVGFGLELAARVRRLPLARLRAIELELDRAAVALDELTGGGKRDAGARNEPVDVARLVASSVEAWRAVAAAQDAAIALDMPSGPLWVLGDRLRLAQAVGNLVANAIEHGGGGVEVSARPSAGMARIEVGDDGPGLAAPIERLVARRGRTGHSARGHGLRIVASVAAAHGGRLATAPSDRGARLVLELPAVAGLTHIVRP